MDGETEAQREEVKEAGLETDCHVPGIVGSFHISGLLNPHNHPAKYVWQADEWPPEMPTSECLEL